MRPTENKTQENQICRKEEPEEKRKAEEEERIFVKPL